MQHIDRSQHTALTGMKRAARKSDMQALTSSQNAEDLDAAWRQLSQAERSALLLMRAFDGEIIHELDDTADGL